MLPNAFIGKTRKPTSKELADTLGPASALWSDLLRQLADLFDSTLEWNSYSPKAGWSLKVKKGKRTILYLAPCAGAFRVAFVLGDKAVKASLASELSSPVRKMIRQAKKYPEGTAVRLEVNGASQLPVILTLASIKLDN